MCGICGLLSFNKINNKKSDIFKTIFLNCESRGNDAFGYYTYPSQKLYKQKGKITEYAKEHSEDLSKDFIGNNLIVAHTRNTTTGTEDKNQNNHPFETKDFIFAHNGIIHNHESLGYKKGTDIETDSIVILKIIQEEYDSKKSISSAIKSMSKKVYGSYACWLVHKKTGTLYFFRHDNPIEIAYSKHHNFFVFASEKNMFDFLEEKVAKGFKNGLAYGDIEEDKIYRLTFKGLFCIGELEPISYYVSYVKSEDESVGYGKFPKGNVSIDYVNNAIDESEKTKGFETEEELDDYLIEYYGTNLKCIRNELDCYGIFLEFFEGYIKLFFSDDDTYNYYKNTLKRGGYTISPKTKEIQLNADDLLYFLDILEIEY